MPNTNDYYTKPKNENDRPKIHLSFRKPMTFFLIIASIILIMSIFFQIGKIEVEGNSVYTDKEIIDASGIQIGDNLFFINRIAAGSRTVVKLPYVDAVTITRGLPNRITILVQESNAVGYINVNGELWTVSGTGKYLGTIEKADAAYMAEIKGITVDKAAIGDTVTAEEKESCSYLLEILNQIQSRGMAAKITGIDVADAENAVVLYDNRFTVKLGEMDNTEYKFGKLVAAIGELGDNDAGTLDLSEGNKVHYNPN
ncbi:MAG: FtsQ-type POTRA domain-containing protein [Bacillota bacterium]|nr:FtsQ-type POTRA domain-containing protein [Bacillota bacterium]